MEEPPPEPVRGMRKLDRVELRIANLERELESDADPSTRAAVLYHIGSLYEHDLDRIDEAMRCYAQSQQTAPSFQPAAIARMRIAERADGAYDATSLCSDMVAAAHAPAVRTAALIDLALRSREGAAPLLQDAIERSPAPTIPALILEWLSEAMDDRQALGRALRAQAEHASHPALSGALWIDVALQEIEQGQVDAALDALERAGRSEDVEWSARGLERRLAKKHGRRDVLVGAATAMASMLEEANQAEHAADPLRLPIPPSQRAPLAALLWQEAATHGNALTDAAEASRYLESALRLLPDDLHIRLQSLSFATQAADHEAIEQASDWFREAAPAHPAFVAYEISRALAVEDEHQALGILREVAARHPSSEYAQAALEVAWMRHDAHAELARRLEERAETAEGAIKQLLDWRAAWTRGASAEGLDATALASAAPSAERWKTPILRDALGAAMLARDADSVVARCDALLECRLHPDERILLSFSKYDALQNVLHRNEEAARVLRDALDQAAHESWAPYLARVRGALNDDPALLARGHEALAALTGGDLRIGHLCAAGQAHARANDWDAAERVVRLALQAAPNDRYVLSLLDGVLRESGQTEQVVALARERDLSHLPDAAELSLLLAGARAEREGNDHAARRAYEQAIGDRPDSVAAALALADVARASSEREVKLRAYQSLAESPLAGGVRELFALLHGDMLATEDGTANQAGDAYEKALEHPISALNAAVALLSMPAHLTTDEQRAAAEEAVRDAEPSFEAPDDDGFGAAYGALRAAFGQKGASTGDAWLQLAALAPSDGLRAATLLQGLRATRIARGDQATDDLFMIAQQVEDLAHVSPDAATAIDEVLAPGDDPELRAAALERKREHCAAAGHGAIEAAHSRALVEADRGIEAVALLSEAVEQRPDDLAIWETLRSAARQAGEWPLVAQACERLAQFVEGSLKADLLEEAAVVRLDGMQQAPQAEDLLRSALEADPGREMAFRRLHDLLAEKEDAEALEALVSARLARGGPKNRTDLLYEHARLLRGFSDRPGALEVLGELFTTDPDHAGALALAAEVHVSLAQWPEAVECLRRLASSSIPDEQRRLAHLGAADFLETRLGVKEEALGELRAIDTLGLADAETLTRIGSLEEALGNADSAIAAHRRALELDPTQPVAIAGLARLLEGERQQWALGQYEEAIWEQIEDGKLDTSSLQGLREAATWRGHTARALAIACVERALGVGPTRSEPWVLRIGDVSLDLLSSHAIDPVLEQVLRRVGPSLFKPRVRSKKTTSADPVCAQLQWLSEQLGTRAESISLGIDLAAPMAYGDSNGGIHWLVPEALREGLGQRSWFLAGRLAWAVPRGAGWWIEDSAGVAAGKIGALLRAARCRVAPGEAMLPAAEIKLRRTARKTVQEIVGDTPLGSEALLTFTRNLQASADRAGLLACGDVEVALATLLGGAPTVAALRSSTRGLDLARFCIDAASPVWRSDA